MQHRVLLALALAILMGAGCLGSSREPVSTTSPAAREPAPCDARVEAERIRAREVDLAADPNDPNRLAAGMMVSIPSTRPSPPDDEPIWTRILRSSDGGQTWRGMDLPGWPGSAEAATSPFAGSIAIGDPVVAFLPDGTLLMLGIMIRADYTLHMFSARFVGDALVPSDVVVLARGAWGDERLTPVTSPWVVGYNDKEEVHVDPATGFVYASWMWRHNDPTQGPQSVPVVAMSKDGGKTWAGPKMVLGGLGAGLTTEEAHVGQVPFTTEDGQAHIVWYAVRAKRLLISSAPLGTLDFGSPRTLVDGATLGSRARAISILLPSAAVAASSPQANETAYVVWSDSRNGSADVLLVRSMDGARTWSDPITVDAGPASTDQLVPVVAATAGGRLGVHYIGWDAAATSYEAFAALSSDHGDTFEVRKISSRPTRISDAAGQRATGIQGHVGDYFGAAFTNGTFMAMWQDGRDGSAQVPFSAAYTCRLPWV